MSTTTDASDLANVSSSSSICPDNQQLVVYSPASVAVFSSLYAAIFVFGIAGNGLVSAAVLRSRGMRTVRNAGGNALIQFRTVQKHFMSIH